VRISPWASNTARAPLGEIPAAWIWSAALTKRGRAAGKSPPATRISTGRSRPLAGSNRWIEPSSSNTIASGPAETDLMSWPSLGRASVTCFVRVSYE
jgi:hypothetical protein